LPEVARLAGKGDVGTRTRPSLLWLKVIQDRLAAPVAYSALAFILVVLYFGKLLGPWSSALLPAAITVAVAFVLSTLQAIERKLSTIGESVVYADTTSAVAELENIVQRDRELTTIKIIAATGGTTLATILPKLCKASRARMVRIELQVIDQASPFKAYFPSHWATEVQASMERAISEYGDGRYSLKISRYSNLPVVHGIMINDSVLLIGFSGWSRETGTPVLSAGDRPHTLYRRNDSDAAQLFWVFEDWFQFTPRDVVYDSNSP